MAISKGSIEKRGKNSWRLTLRIKGKEPIKQTLHFPSIMPEEEQREECEVELARMRVHEHDYRNDPDSTLTFKQLSRMVMKDRILPNCKPNTVQYYLDMFAVIWIYIGDTLVLDITPYSCTQTVNQIAQRTNQKTHLPLSPTTVRHYCTAMKTVFDTAVEWDIITKNPMRATKLPRARHKEMKYYTEEQTRAVIQRLMETVDIFHIAASLVPLCSGMRKGEVGALRWPDVSFEKSYIRICRSRNYLPGIGVFEDTPKTEAGLRSISMPQGAMDVLKLLRLEYRKTEAIMRQSGQWIGDGHVFCNEFGRPYHPDTISKWWNKWIARQPDLPQIRYHDLRHTHATILFPRVDVITLAKRLGHGDPQTTIRDYGHTTDERDYAAAEAFDAAIFQPIAAKAKVEADKTGA